MPKQSKQPASEIEFAIFSHPARPGWHILRVMYPNTPEAEGRIGRALDAIHGRSALPPVEPMRAADEGERTEGDGSNAEARAT